MCVVCGIVDELTEEGPFYLGKEPSMLEVTTFPFVERLPVLEALKQVSVKELLDGENNKTLQAWYDAMNTLPAMDTIRKVTKDETGKERMETLTEQYKGLIAKMAKK